MSDKLKRLLRCLPCSAAFVFGSLAFMSAFAYFFHFEFASGNLWKPYAYAEMFAALANAALFGAYLSMSAYRFVSYGRPSGKHSGIAAAWAFLSALVAGCPACAPTLASVLGLASVASVFPGWGLGLKAFWGALLSYSVWKTYRDLDTCKRKA